MSLRLRLVLTLWLVTLLAGALTVGFAATAAYETADRSTRNTLTRAGYALERAYHMEPRAGDPLYTEMTSIKLLGLMAPGTCIRFEQRLISERRICASWQMFGPIAPDGFRKTVTRVFGPVAPATGEGRAPGGGIFSVEVTFDPVAAATLAWQRVRLALWQTLGMAAGVLFLGTLAIYSRLEPVGPIVRGLDRLSAGDLDTRVTRSGAPEFRKIADAVNRLAQQLTASTEARRVLTRRLIEVEDVERRQLARDLHDEFGQMLTATAALAASIGLAAPPGHPALARDAEAIGANIRAMMTCLRGAFARLRPPDLDEVGLTASLRGMLSGWQAQSGARLRLDSTLDEDGLSGAVALDLYRIVQECVTNAMRHGTPSRVDVALHAEGDAIVLTVEDDGGGHIDGGAPGHGLIGMAERTEAMGGRLRLEEGARGVRIRVRLPMARGRSAA
ncbi:histidine kinase [Rhodovulum viride]|uniref:Histidine kinase n=1 Tax=Rhodovulum viride TaxID=1231134 RepID=A0ABX9DHS2_9RHOB|nr:ATP-binding protein [Rhodovulum viride]RAP41927.1 histidine kinase [Rhodovulum viride]